MCQRIRRTLRPSDGLRVRMRTTLILRRLLLGSKSLVTGGVGVEKSDPEVYASPTATHPL
jgi:hypothetical protein